MFSSRWSGLTAQPVSGASRAATENSTRERNGQLDFSPLLGSWKYHLKRRLRPLTGSTDWVEFDGTGVCYKVWDGRSQLDTIEVDGPAGHIEGLTLRLYDPQSHRWRLYWVNSKVGIMDPPQVGQFKDGTGEFYAQDTLNGKSIMIRFLWTKITSDSPHFEQSFSADGGKTWEVNWITDQTRVPDEPERAPAIAASGAQDHQHDFDFEFGAWKTHIRHLLRPLSGSDQWTDLDGTSVVHKIWGGRANLGELEVTGEAASIEGLSLRVYNPTSRQWSIFWSNAKEGVLGAPMVGRFVNGRGEFYDQETFQGAAIFVRFIFSDITPTAFRLEQAFSADGGKTWEPNWIATFTRQKQ